MGHLTAPTNFRYSFTLFWKSEWVSILNHSSISYFYQDNIIINLVNWFYKTQLIKNNYIISNVRILRSFSSILVLILFYNADYERYLNNYFFIIKKKLFKKKLFKNFNKIKYIKNLNNFFLNNTLLKHVYSFFKNFLFYYQKSLNKVYIKNLLLSKKFKIIFLYLNAVNVYLKKL